MSLLNVKFNKTYCLGNRVKLCVLMTLFVHLEKEMDEMKHESFDFWFYHLFRKRHGKEGQYRNVKLGTERYENEKRVHHFLIDELFLY